MQMVDIEELCSAFVPKWNQSKIQSAVQSYSLTKRILRLTETLYEEYILEQPFGVLLPGNFDQDTGLLYRECWTNFVRTYYQARDPEAGHFC